MGRDERSNTNGSRRLVTGLPGGPQTPRLRDALGRILELGDEVLLAMPTVIMRVAAVRPILHPGAPPNTVAVTLVCKVEVAGTHDTGIENCYRLRHQAEIGDGAITGPEPPPPPPDASPSGIVL